MGSRAQGPLQPRKRKPFHRTPGPEFGAALSFQEIADVLGVTHQAVQQSYRSGLRKLRAYHPEALARLQLIAGELARTRDARMIRE